MGALPAIVNEVTAAQNALTAGANNAVRDAWRALPGYDRKHVAGFVQDATRVVAQAQGQAIALSSAYVAEVTGVPVLGLDAQQLVAGMRGVTAAEVYQRPFVSVWSQLAQGTEWARAVDVGSNRLSELVVADVQMAALAGEHRALGAAGVRYYRRVLGAGKTHCPVCYAAAANRFRVYPDGRDRFSRGDFAYHTRCSCRAYPLPPNAPRHVERIDSAGNRPAQPDGYDDWRHPDHLKAHHPELGPGFTEAVTRNVPMPPVGAATPRALASTLEALADAANYTATSKALTGAGWKIVDRSKLSELVAERNNQRIVVRLQPRPGGGLIVTDVVPA